MREGIRIMFKRRQKFFVWTLSGLFLFTTLFLMGQPLQAAIFKWKDDRGKVHFTDDVTKIPDRYRLKAKNADPEETPLSEADFVAPEVAEPETFEEDSVSEDKTVEEEETPVSEPEPAENIKSELTQEEQAAIQEAIALLQSEIARDQQWAQLHVNRSNGKQIMQSIQEALPGKLALASKLAQFDLPILQETYGFLQQNIEMESTIDPVGPRLRTRMRRTVSRLEGELPVKTQLVERLQQEISPS